LGFEQLEERRLLSITVNTLVDEADGSIVDGDISLRDAIVLASPGETVDFSVTGTINLSSLGQLTINKSLTIDGPGANLLTIDAQHNSRVFNIDDGNGNADKLAAISGLTLTGGNTDLGGAVLARENLSVTDTMISGNFADAGGGVAIQYGNVTVTGSTISNNSARYGGGIYKIGGDLTIAGSTISDNRAYDEGGGLFDLGGTTVSRSAITDNMADRRGGGIKSFGNLTVIGSTISGNDASGGGGINSSGSTTIVDSTISSNNAAYGGGVYAQAVFADVPVTIANTTMSGNSASMSGGAAFLSSLFGEMKAVIRHSTITGNEAPTGSGGGISSGASEDGIRIEVSSSILADSLNGGDVVFGGVGNPFVSLAYNLVGTGNGTAAFTALTGDQVGVAPSLGPLADNGGPTMAHAFLVGCPAIDAGDPSAVAGVGDVPLYDQRGNPFTRVHGGRIDIGAFELQSTSPELPGDYDLDGEVDDADYLLWKQQFGSMVAVYSGSDGNGNGGVDAADYTVWRDNFGSAAPSTALQPVATLERDQANRVASDEFAQFPLISVPTTTGFTLSNATGHLSQPRQRPFVESVDRAFELLLLQPFPRQRLGERTALQESDIGPTSRVPDDAREKLDDDGLDLCHLHELLFRRIPRL
jgi:hypothetical protein